MSVKPNDTLLIGMSLFRSMWTQTVLVLGTAKYVDFHISLAGQSQGFAWFSIEPHDGAISSVMNIVETTIRFASPSQNNCKLESHGPDDVVTAPIIGEGGQSCYVDKISLNPPLHSQAIKPRPQFR